MLSEVCQELGLLKSSQARFYVASMILALEYMHSHDMAHRDVKLENMIIDEMVRHSLSIWFNSFPCDDRDISN